MPTSPMHCQVYLAKYCQTTVAVKVLSGHGRDLNASASVVQSSMLRQLSKARCARCAAFSLLCRPPPPGSAPRAWQRRLHGAHCC